MAVPSRKVGAAAGRVSRVQNTTSAATVKTGAGLLQRLIVANADVAAQTVTIADGATTRLVARIAAGTTVSLEFGMPFATSLVITPSDTDLDVLVLFD